MPDHFPPEIITEILSRLDIKTLLRCKAVSKQWRSLIDGKHFIRTHLNRSIKTNTNITLFLLNRYFRLYSVDVVGTLYPGNPVKLHDRDLYRFLGSCHGMLCLWNTGADVFILNPSTRKYKYLPSFASYEFDCAAHLLPDGFSVIGTGYGFGYDAVSDDYKVVMIADVGARYSEIRIYSARKDSCRIIKSRYFVRSMQQRGFYVGGALHWLGSRFSDPRSTRRILGFDLGVDKFREIVHPDFGCAVSRLFAGELDGCLCLVAVVGNLSDVWVMREYGAEESWIKLFSISCLRSSDYLSMRLLGFFRDGKAVLLELDMQLFWYDIEGNTLVHFVVEGGNEQERFQAIFCYNSLVQP